MILNFGLVAILVSTKSKNSLVDLLKKSSAFRAAHITKSQSSEIALGTIESLAKSGFETLGCFG